MFSLRITSVPIRKIFLMPVSVMAHSNTCPATRKKPVCPGSGGGTLTKGGGIKVVVEGTLKRAERSGPTRFGLIPEEWFVFFYPKTGVSGPYLFGLTLANYLLSKEIYVLEHEYYLGLSIGLVTYFLTTRIGPSAGASLDSGVDAIVEEWEKDRRNEKAMHEDTIAAAKDAQMRAEGQKLLMDAKKENIAMQLEAAYRERMMLVYRTVKGRMDYHVKRYRAEAKIHQKWMIGWILQNVRQAITPEFEKQALERAIQDLAVAAGRAG